MRDNKKRNALRLLNIHAKRFARLVYVSQPNYLKIHGELDVMKLCLPPHRMKVPRELDVAPLCPRDL